ncbi:MAG: rhomboid family intramembrane serine protease [Gemmataceae bacterium]|nr:rhomboid family intramembrane serine protease [Gemmata sp.]MDW8197636.1 rhomboid family intramembrane serine protease [Gemmataceae bacterium]
MLATSTETRKLVIMPSMESDHASAISSPPESLEIPRTEATSRDAAATSSPAAHHRPPPTAEQLLRLIASAPQPWFPATYAAQCGINRDQLDEPLLQLRWTELIQVVDWVRGVGQGYEITDAGRLAVKDAAVMNRFRQAWQNASTPPSPRTTEAEPNASPWQPEAEADDAALNFRPPLVVPVLVLANVVWFLVCVVMSLRRGFTVMRSLTEGHRDVLHELGAIMGSDLLQGEWWRLLTCCFVHIGALHLIANMLALAMMGPLAELLWGRWRLLLIYAIAGWSGSVVAMLLRPETLLAGASGAIWGILMSLFVWLYSYRRYLPADVATDWFRRLLVVFILSAGVSFLPGISWEGHLGGGVAGFLTAGLLTTARRGDRLRQISAWFLMVLLPVLAVAALAAAMDAPGMAAWQQLRERAAHQHALEIEHTYNTAIAPRLAELAPARLKPEEAQIGMLLLRKRSPEKIAAAEAQVKHWKTLAATLVQITSREPTGNLAFDQQCQRIHAFAQARLKSFDLLLELLAAPEQPAAAQWDAWRAQQRFAEQLWPLPP